MQANNMSSKHHQTSFGSTRFLLKISSSVRSSKHKPSAARLAGSLAVDAADAAKKRCLQTLPQSLLEQANDFIDEQNVVAPFKQEEIILGPRLGSGEFSHVYEVQSFDLEPEVLDEGKKSTEERNKRLYMKQYEKYRETKNARYALKHLKETYLKKHGLDDYLHAVSDLAMEAQLLASLDHPHIIKLRGITYSGVSGFSNGPQGYYLIIDRLQETLDQRILKWRSQDKDRIATKKTKGRRGASQLLRSSIKLSFVSKSKEAGEGVEVVDELIKQDPIEAMDERLSIALQISAALMYLHSHSIIFRDLKPANIGFDVRGDVKIFDFGLARAMPKVGDHHNDLYEMSGAGSPRYMAPECLCHEEYNLKADVYTFAIVVWEMLSCKVPYSYVRSREDLLEDVVDKHIRPEMEDSWPSKIQGMLESSFMDDTMRRPSMKLWYDTLRDVLADLRGGCRRNLNDNHIQRRRTQGSMRDLMNGLDKETFYKEIIKGPGKRNSTDW